jgi:hypothetical protein
VRYGPTQPLVGQLEVPLWPAIVDPTNQGAGDDQLPLLFSFVDADGNVATQRYLDLAISRTSGPFSQPNVTTAIIVE